MAHKALVWRWTVIPFTIVALFIGLGEHASLAKDCRIAGTPAAIGINDYNCFEDVTEVKISKDGKYVAYVFGGAVHVRASDGGEQWTPLKSRREETWSPVWSPNGDALYVLAKPSHQTEIWQIPISGNREPKRIARTDLDIDSIKLSPNRSRLLLELTCPSNQRDHFHPGECAEPKPEEEKPLVISGMIFKEDGAGYLVTEKKKRVYSLELASNILRPLSFDAKPNSVEDQDINHDTEAAWSSSGDKKIAFIREYPSSLQYHSELWIAPSQETANDGAQQLAFLPKAERRLPSWSGDGQSIAYLWSDAQLGPYAVKHLAIYSFADKKEKILTQSLDRTVRSFRFSLDNRFVYFLYAKEGGQYLARIRLRDDQGNRIGQAAIEPVIPEGDYFISDFDVGKDGQLAMVIHNEKQDGPAMVYLPDVYVAKPGQPLKRLTDFNKAFFKSHKVATKERVFIKREGERLFEMFVTKPFGFQTNRKYPAILNIHGGPTDDWHTFEYDWFAQFLAANGYIVIEPNPLGSLGGNQEQVRKIYHNWGCDDRLDVLRAVEEVIERGWADPEKLFVTGYSYGGYMTNCLITQVPGKFKAAASGAGHSLIAANFGHDQWLQWYNWELGPPWKNRELYRKLSPLDRAGEVKTPTLFLGGNADWNVPILNLELFYQSLRVQGIDTKLVIYPGAAHASNWSEEFSLDYYRRILSWFDCHGGREMRAGECTN
jgi:dipeptidyl aminopeptidase/acylaminoacyl peptidase